MMQFSLVSLIPGLLRNLQDSAGPELDSYEKNLKRPTSLRTSDRNSLLAYMGLPLQIFGKVGRKLPFDEPNAHKEMNNREVCLGLIPLCNSWMFWQTLVPNHTLWAAQTRYYCSKGIATAIF